MVGERWRPAVLVLAGTVWIWALVMPRLRGIMVNPDIHPTSELLWVIAVMVVLVAVDIGAIVYMLPRRSEDSARQDQDSR